jgi:thioredoxin 1
MSFAETYQSEQPERAEIDAAQGAMVLEFGTNWCGFCRNAQPAIREALAEQLDLRHVKVEDGPGRPLGRSYRIKLWPTLVMLKDGVEVGRVVRPADATEVRQQLAALL